MTLKTLSDPQLMRYSRQIMLPSLDIDGQTALYNARVLCIGVGGLGCAATQYLVSAGLGELTLMDDDVVEHSNLQRQVLHHYEHVGMRKCDSAYTTLHGINPDTQINLIYNRADENELSALVSVHDLVLDCTDNLPTRNLINAACATYNVPLVMGAAIRFEGHVASFFHTPHSGCYCCVSQMFDDPQLSCSEAGILAPAVGVVGALQASEAIKIITGCATALTRKWLMLDLAAMDFTPIAIPDNLDCDVCRDFQSGQ